MKQAFVLAAFLVLPVAVQAQLTKTNAVPARADAPAQVKHPENPAQVQVPTTIPGERFVLKKPAPNEIISGNISYSGVAVEIAKTHSPLQLFNPVNPPKGASPEQNVFRDPINGRVKGLKFFSFHF